MRAFSTFIFINTDSVDISYKASDTDVAIVRSLSVGADFRCRAGMKPIPAFVMIDAASG